MPIEVGSVIQPVEIPSDESELTLVEAEIDVSITNSLTVVEPENTFCVEAQIQQWVLTSDDIYIIQEYGDVPDWLETLIMDIAASPDGTIINNINDLTALVNALDEGFTNEIFRLDGVDFTQTIDFESLKSSYDDTAAIVLDIDSTYASKDYAEAISYDVVAAYINGGDGAAWFEQSVSTIADIAYSAARSASSLNASIVTVDAYAKAIAGDVEILKKQVDGQVVTWFVANADYGDGSYFNTIGPVLPDGSVNPACEPYSLWTEDEIPVHTGDTLIYYQIVDDNKEILSTWRFGTDPDTNVFNWFLFTDDLATEAYIAALNAQATADGKIVTFYGPNDPELTPGVVLGVGDLWIDSDGFATDGNIIAPFDNAGILLRWNGAIWEDMTDLRISASVDRLDSATVDIDGNAVAKGSLLVEATGSSGETAIAGYVATANSGTNDSSSTFKIFADKFMFATTAGADPIYAPFTIDTTVSPSQIKFNGIVNFENPVNPLPEPDLDTYVEFTDLSTSQTTTVINGANIRTGYMLAQYIAANSIWVGGIVTSSDYSYLGGPGFRLKANAASIYNDPDIYGAYMRGGTIAASTIAFGGARWESTAGDGHTGNTGYTAASDMTYAAGNVASKYLTSELLVGPSYSSGYRDDRVLSRTTSTCLVTASFQAHIGNGDVLVVLEYATHNGTAWTPYTVLKSYRFYDNTLIFPVLQASVPMNKLPGDDHLIIFRARSTFNASFGAGRMSMSIDLRN